MTSPNTTKSNVEQILRNRVKLIGDGDWTLLGTPNDVIKELEALIKTEATEARYMGSLDFSTWVIRHDKSSFRQERAWFKIKPSLIVEYQAELLNNLDRVRTNAGLDPNSTVPQLKTDPNLKALQKDRS